MPQTKPMNWLVLFFYIIFIFLSISVVILLMDNSTPNIGSKSFNKLNLEW
uniref:ATP synthase F0 subunit 8 n=1 Tax=Steganacarus magnus TaxID=52000 RepID=B6Z5U6_9ACAR|nr:ATP synthase F0 subunit 8 [Steganacarus magnus]ACH41147.1 ATP synthase F0 subunit 8 [Steganacarus magnus]